MNKIFFVKTFLIALCALPCVVSAKDLASEVPFNVSEKVTHQAAGERAGTQLEYVQRMEARFIEIEEKQAEGYETAVEAEAAMESQEGIAASAAFEQESNVDGLVARNRFKTSHPGAIHNPRMVAGLGERVWLEDGSSWEVRHNDRQKTLDWFTGDNVSITPNHQWFSSFRYCLNDREANVSVKVNLTEVTFGGNFYIPHQITNIDYSSREVCLEDGSIWYISWWDRNELKRWQIGDFVIIGVNDGWWTSKKNILINVHTLDYASTNCIYY